MAGAAPPGLISPAAFPFPAGLPNDAPPTVPVPYLIGIGLKSASGQTVTIPVQNPTSPGDAIVVTCTSSQQIAGAGIANGTCTDTQGNAYSLPVTQTANARGGLFTAQDAAQLGTSDTFTVTWASNVPGLKQAMAIGVPAGCIPGNPANGFLTFNLGRAAGGSTGPISLPTPAGVAVPATQMIIAAAYNSFSDGPPQFPQGWNVLATSLDGANTTYVVMAYKLQSANIAAGANVVSTLQGSGANASLMYLTLIPETRFASQPGVISQPSPPGLMSPGAWPVLPQPPRTVNDAPPASAPYLIGSTAGAVTATKTITPQVTTGRGDAIVVLCGGNGASDPPTSCTDTQGNAYSLTILSAATFKVAGQFTAVNAVPLTPADTITVTYPGTTGAARFCIAAGVPAAAQGAAPGFVVPDQTATSGANSTRLNFTTALNLTGTPEIVIGFAEASSASGPVNWPPPWTPLTGLNVAGGDSCSAAWMTAVSRAAPQMNLTFATGNVQGLITAFTPETRFAPKSPPDMPPGMQSPGAWQYAPLSPPEGPWSAHYNPGPNKWAETLPAGTASQGKVTRTTGKLIPATAHPAGVLARAIARLRTYAATPRAAAAITRNAGKNLAATPRAAGKLARTCGKNLAAATTTTADIIRGRAKRLAARITAAARLIVSGSSAPVFSLGVPQTEWNVSISTIGLSHLATQYVIVPVAATRAGLSYNPTSDTVQFAFAATATYVPQSGDWVTGVWETDTTNLLYPYAAKCLVGPSGTTTLGIGTYVMYVRISDNPEVPVLIAGQLQIQ